MTRNETIRNRLLSIITVILAIGALRASYPVTMPLTAAFVVIAAIWPIKPWLDRFLTPGLSYVATMLVLAVVVTGFTVAIYFSAAQVVSAFERSWDRLDVLYRHVSDWTASWGWPLDGEEGYLRFVGVARDSCRTSTRFSAILASPPSWSFSGCRRFQPCGSSSVRPSRATSSRRCSPQSRRSPRRSASISASAPSRACSREWRRASTRSPSASIWRSSGAFSIFS